MAKRKVSKKRKPAKKKVAKRKPAKCPTVVGRIGSGGYISSGGRISERERDALPKSAFGLPSERKYPVRRMWGGKALPDRDLAIAAKSRATTQLERGNLTKAQHARIVRKADKVIAQCGRKNNPAEYRRTHEGEDGARSYVTLNVPDPTKKHLVLLGELRELTYRTKKGSDERLTDYVHKFQPPRPHLVYSARDDALYITTAGFRVTERGIVG